MEKIGDEAFVSLICDDAYAAGAVVLGTSLKDSKTTRKTVLLVTEGVSDCKRNQLSAIWDELIDVTPLYTTDLENLALTKRPELGITFTKLKIWTLVQFRKCVFLDADTLILQNVDELFEREELSAAPDIGWPDCFNSGVFVFVPSKETYDALIKFADEQGSFDGGDQGLLNMYFKDWATKDIAYHLPFVYNMVANICYSYAPAYKKFGRDAKIVHYLGAIKPWHHFFDTETSQVHVKQAGGVVEGVQHFIQLWWDTYTGKEDMPSPTEGQVSSAQAIVPGAAKAMTEGEHKASWERGMIDFTGEDKFENIKEKLDDTINGTMPTPKTQ
eukprot:Seg5078.2 transcript_id=Seg5078.2/GoldUCD/mRNA.D3Y31 product=Glycogenin-1 protein_id=Seg5078.2/GoldUCD/D3Y31